MVLCGYPERFENKKPQIKAPRVMSLQGRDPEGNFYLQVKGERSLLPDTENHSLMLSRTIKR